jgi:hypothetical protein
MNYSDLELMEFKRRRIELINLKYDADALIHHIWLYVALHINELRTNPDYYKMPDTRDF